jgi:hypothetical protein
MAVLNSLTSPGSRRVYQFAINQDFKRIRHEQRDFRP